MAKYVMALDAGTTSNRCILFNEKVRCAAWHRGIYTVLPTAGLGGT